jgi:hypothetical protein
MGVLFITSEENTDLWQNAKYSALLKVNRRINARSGHFYCWIRGMKIYAPLIRYSPIEHKLYIFRV